MMSDAQYQSWLNDSSRNAFRIMLIECEHATGTVTLASKAWLSDTHVPYDDWLISEPFMESLLDAIGGIGDFEAVNLDPTDRWDDHTWHGFACHWSYGDLSWARDEFRAIGTSLHDAVRPLGNSAYKFELMDEGRNLLRSLVSTDTTRTETVADALDWLLDQTGVMVALFNIPETRLSWQVSYTMSPTSTAFEVLKLIAASINARFAVDQFGNAELLRFSATDAVRLDEDSIGSDRLGVTDIIPAYATVSVIRADGTRMPRATDIAAGRVLEDLDITTALTSTSNANTVLNEYVDYHANSHFIYSIPVVDVANLLKPGQSVTIDHPQLSQTGLIKRILRTPLSTASDIEVEI